MRSVRRAGSAGVLALGLAAFAGVTRGAQQPGVPPPSAAPSAVQQAPGREAFGGVWTYNPDDSVNAATGRPEMSLDQRRAAGFGRDPGARGAGRGAAPADAGGGSMGGGIGLGGEGRTAGGEQGGFATGGLGSEIAAAEVRRIQRDLLEMARKWTITIAEDAVTFKDDLDRERTYPTTGKKEKYLLGAAEFEATAHWDGPRLVKDIEAAYGFRMTETYFLSSDGTRLFAIIRVLGKKKDAPVVGANRVYDRVQ